MPAPGWRRRAASALIHTEAEEHVPRRLGKAVLALWSDLPPEVRNALFEQALLVGDRHEAEDLRHDIWALILKHQGDPG